MWFGVQSMEAQKKVLKNKVVQSKGYLLLIHFWTPTHSGPILGGRLYHFNHKFKALRTPPSSASGEMEGPIGAFGLLFITIKLFFKSKFPFLGGLFYTTFLFEASLHLVFIFWKGSF